MNITHQVLQYILFWLNEESRHSFHSPFLYKLHDEVLKDRSDSETRSPEILRQELMQENRQVDVPTSGAPSRSGKGQQRSMKQLLTKGSIRPKYGRLLKRLTCFTQSRDILELGTSLGISTLYLSADDKARVITMEGNSQLCSLARINFHNFHRTNIRLIEGQIDDKLTGIVTDMERIDFVFMDANHRYDPTIHYYTEILKKCHSHSVIVMDDIHWSADMSKAWNEVSRREEVHLSLDLYQMGILFLDPSLSPGRYRISC